MSYSQISGGVWPPKGWDQFKDIELLTDQTIHKDPISSKVTGLAYTVEPIPVIKKQNRIHIYNISIESWEYSISNESRELPVLSFLLGEVKPMPMARELVIENIKSYSRSINTTAKSAYSALSAALYFMRQINEDKMPDIDQALKLYQLHPSQKNKYDTFSKKMLKVSAQRPFLLKEEKVS